jgi:hypothetical protein
MTTINLAAPRLHTPNHPVPEHAFYVEDHLIVVKPWSPAVRNCPVRLSSYSLYLRRVSDWTPSWS